MNAKSVSVPVNMRLLTTRDVTTGCAAAAALAVWLAWPDPASAACSTPSGIEGEMRYFSGDQAYKYCDGADWSPMGGSMPAGAIAAFETSCPAGWAAYTPAEGRFVVGAGNYASGADADGANPATSYAAGDTGGTMDEVLTIGEMPSHRHSETDPTIGSLTVASDTAVSQSSDGDTKEYVTPGNSWTSYTGGGSAQENRPPYVALTWCEKQLDVDAVAGSSIDGLADVDTTTSAPADNDPLVWDGGAGEWVPASDPDVEHWRHVGALLTAPTVISLEGGRTFIDGTDSADMHWFATSDGPPEPGNLFLALKTDGASAPDKIFLAPGGTEGIGKDGLVVDSHKRVGIGTISPQQMLHIDNGTTGAGDQTVVQLGSGRDSMFLTHNDPGMTYNMRFDDGQWRHHADGPGAGVHLGSGQIGFRVWPSGTAGDVATSGSVAVTIDNDGDMGIGTTSPSARLEVVGNGAHVRLAQSNGTNQIASGSRANRMWSNADCSSAADYNCGAVEIREVALVNNSTTNANYAPRITFHWGDITTSSIYMDSAGNYHFRSGTGSYDILHAAGYNTSSDARLKSEIRSLSDPLKKIERIRGVSFRRNGKAERSVGFIAQEIEVEFPELVDTDSRGYKSVDYGAMAAPLLEAVKRLNEKVEAQARRIRKLERQAATGR